MESNLQKLSIAHVNGRDAGGGTDSAAYELHRELIRQGMRSQLIVGEKVGNDDSVCQIRYRKGVPGLKRLSLKLEQMFGFQYLYSPRFRALQDEFTERVDVIHLHSLHGVGGYADIGHLPWLARRWPLVLSLQDMWMLTGHCGYGTGCDRWKAGCGRCPNLSIYPAIPKDGTRWNWIRKRKVISKCPGIQVTACSKWLADEARRSPIFADVSIHTVLNAIDTMSFTPGNQAKARERFGLPQERFIVLLCANSLSNIWKGAADGIQALNALAQSNIHVVLVGHNGSDAEKLLKLPTTVLHYQTSREALADVYRAADLLLMPSTEEAFGLVAAEAMACQTPVVAYASGGLPEVVTQECGIVVPTGEINQLSEAMRHMISNPVQCKKMGAAAAVSSAMRFSILHQTETFQKIYQMAVLEHRLNS